VLGWEPLVDTAEAVRKLAREAGCPTVECQS
jgi:hypothetical protein